MIDWDRVRVLHDEVGQEDFDEIVELFLEEVTATVADLPNTAEKGALGESLHFLKGSALSLGFAQFSELCSEGEAEAENGSPDQIDLAEIRTAFAASRQSFLEGLANIKAA